MCIPRSAFLSLTEREDKRRESRETLISTNFNVRSMEAENFRVTHAKRRIQLHAVASS